MSKYIEIFVIALITSWVLTPYVGRFAIRCGIVDVPNARRLNRVPVPTGGGLAIFIAFWLALLITGASHPALPGLMVGSLIICLTGFLDDLWEISPAVKLMGQVLAALAVVAGGTVIRFVTNPLGGMFYLGWLGIPVTIVWIVAVINMINFIDGLDGLAAGVAVIACLPLFLVAWRLGYEFVALLLLGLAGATLGFLRYNFNPAQLFMGDTGAMFLGFMLGALSVEGTLKGATTVALAVPVLILGLPVMDTLFSVVRRLRSGRPVYQADRGHLHHRLLDLGLSQRQTVVLLYAWAGLLGLAALILAEEPPALAMICVIFLITGLFVVADRLGWMNGSPGSHNAGRENLGA